MYGKTRKGMIRNKNIRKSVRVTPIIEKMVEKDLGGLGI